MKIKKSIDIGGVEIARYRAEQAKDIGGDTITVMAIFIVPGAVKKYQDGLVLTGVIQVASVDLCLAHRLPSLGIVPCLG